jgi:hypothetical protein
MGAGGDDLAILFDGRLLQTVEIVEERLPFGVQALFLAKAGQLLGKSEREERDEHMAADSGIGLVEDGPGVEAGVRDTEQGLHLQEVTVADDGLKRRNPGIGAQHADAVEASLIGEFADIDLEGFATGLDVATVGRVADKRLVTLFQLRLEAIDDRLTVRLVLFRLGVVEGDDIVHSLSPCKPIRSLFVYPIDISHDAFRWDICQVSSRRA